MESDKYNSLIDALFEGRADADETARLLAGSTGEELEELSELVETLARIDPELELPSEGEFRAARQGVLAQIGAERAPARAPSTRWLALAATLAAFAVGLAVGRGGATPAAPLPNLTLTDLVSRSALVNDPDTNFQYSNLRLREVDGDSLAVTVDVAAELEFIRPKNDLLVSDILADSLLGEDPLGTRLKAVRHAGRNPRVQLALMAAARTDPDMSVRLKALERLITTAPDAPQTQETLLAIVESEPSVVMRLVALDALSDAYIGPKLLDQLENEVPEDGESAVLWQAQQRINRRSL